MMENAMQMMGRKPARQPLGVLPVGDPQKGVVGGDKLDPRSAELARQPGMAVAIELQPEWTPGWHPQMDQSQLCIHEVEVVVQAFAAVRLEKALAGLLVVPGLVAVAGLHGRDHMHQAGMIPPLGQYFGDHLFLANMALGDVLDRNPRLARNRRRLLTHSITQRRGKLRVVENTYALRISDLLQIEWVKWGGFSQVECDSKGFFVNVTVTSSRHVCAHAKIEQDEAPER